MIADLIDMSLDISTEFLRQSQVITAHEDSFQHRVEPKVLITGVEKLLKSKAHFHLLFSDECGRLFK